MYFSLLVSDNSLIIVLFFYSEKKNQLRKFIHGAELSGFKKVVPRYKVQVNLKNGNFALCNLANVKSNFCAGQKGRARATELTRIRLRPVAIENSRLGIRSIDVRQRRDTSTFCRQCRKLRSARSLHRRLTCTATYYLRHRGLLDTKATYFLQSLSNFWKIAGYTYLLESINSF